MKYFLLFISIFFVIHSFAEKPVPGGLDPDLIRSILIPKIPQMRTCYNNELVHSSEPFDFRAQLKFIINKDGATDHISVLAPSTNTQIPNIISCIKQVLKKTIFPKPLGGGTVEINQPLNFYQRK